MSRPVSPMDCETPKRSWGSCIQAMAAGWINVTDLCPVCTGVLMQSLGAVVTGLEWHQGFRDRLAEVSR